MSIKKNILQQLYESTLLGYVTLNKNYQVLYTELTIKEFGYNTPLLGQDLREVMDFAHGLDLSKRYDIPMLETPNKGTISIALLPSEQQCTLVFTNVNAQFEQKRTLQQIANENQLLANELAKTTQKLQKANELQSHFLSKASHEFRTPAISIRGFAQIIQNTKEENFSYKDIKLHAHSIYRSSIHLLSLIDNLLENGKLNANIDAIQIHPEPTKVAILLDDMKYIFNSLVSTSVQFSIEHNISAEHWYLVDEKRLQQCLINLISNAVKFTSKGKIVVYCHYSNDFLQLKVQDTGIGIPSENFSKILLPFWRNKKKQHQGTGLGLSIVAHLLELMGSKLEINSIVGKGSAFAFALAAPKLNELELIALQKKQVMSDLKVLVVDDDDDIAKLTKILLEEQGFQVCLADNGQKAITLMQKQISFDIIIMDIHMPGMDGAETSKAIRAFDMVTPIIGMTAARLHFPEDFTQYHFDAYLEKPIKINSFLKIAQELIK